MQKYTPYHGTNLTWTIFLGGYFSHSKAKNEIDLENILQHFYGHSELSHQWLKLLEKLVKRYKPCKFGF